MGNEALNWDGLRVYEKKKRMETAVFRLQYVCSRGNIIYRLLFIKYLKQRPPTCSQTVTCFMEDVSSYEILT